MTCLFLCFVITHFLPKPNASNVENFKRPELFNQENHFHFSLWLIENLSFDVFLLSSVIGVFPELKFIWVESNLRECRAWRVICLLFRLNSITKFTPCRVHSSTSWEHCTDSRFAVGSSLLKSAVHVPGGHFGYRR